MTPEASNPGVRLEPCPLDCPGVGVRVDFPTTDTPNAAASCIECSVCGLTTKLFFGEKVGLYDAWNRRPSLPVSEGGVVAWMDHAGNVVKAATREDMSDLGKECYSAALVLASSRDALAERLRGVTEVLKEIANPHPTWGSEYLKGIARAALEAP